MTLTLVCEACGEVFEPSDARGIAIFGPGYAHYGCPECSYTIRSVPPGPEEFEDDGEDSDDEA